MSRRRAGALAIATLVATLVSPAAPAVGAPAPSAPLVRGISDGGLFGSRDPELRAGAARVAGAAQARIARFPIAWSTVLRRRGFVRPSERQLSLSDPANRTYDWSRIDAAVRDAAGAGLEPMAYFMTAPRWAESAPRYRFAPAGTWAPQPAALGQFASAVARRFDGTYPDPLHPGQALPRISRFQSWNEPNLGRFLQPLWVPTRSGRPRLFAAGWYREMHRAVDAAIHARQPEALVGLAGLPAGNPRFDGEGRVAPIRFLRALLCVGHEQPGDCGEPLRVDALSVHPLTVGDPDTAAEGADDLSVADVEPKLRTVLRAAARANQLPAGPEPALWVTEMNWMGSGPNSVPRRDQGLVVGRAMRRFWQAGATVVNWQFAVDPVKTRTSGRQRRAGLVRRRAGTVGVPGRPKAFLAGFLVPTVAIPTGHGRAYVWVLTPPGAGAAQLEVRRRGRWGSLARLPVTGDVAEGFVGVRRGLTIRAVAGSAVGAPVVVQRFSGVPTWGVTPRPQAGAAAAGRPTSPPDPRVLDANGPGAFAARAPFVTNGMPPQLLGPSRLVRAPARITGRLTFGEGRRLGVVLGTRGNDRFSGTGGLFVGFGGRDS